MPSGGARTRSGPAPDPNAFRREHDGSEWVALPAAGRSGAAPEWPLLGHSDREAEIWVELWAKPQAVMWEHNDQRYEVALYVRNLTIVELPGSPVNLATLLRQQADSLGLTVPGLRANRLRISGNVASPQPKEAAGAVKRSSRARLKVVGGGSA